jgi:hypothetical protein
MAVLIQQVWDHGDGDAVASDSDGPSLAAPALPLTQRDNGDWPRSRPDFDLIAQNITGLLVETDAAVHAGRYLSLPRKSCGCQSDNSEQFGDAGHAQTSSGCE